MNEQELKQAELLVRILETGLVTNDKEYKKLILSQLSSLLINETIFDSYRESVKPIIDPVKHPESYKMMIFRDKKSDV